MSVRILLIESICNNSLMENNHPSLGLAYIAGSLKHKFSDRIECKIIKDNLVDTIQRFKPDVVGISSVSKNYDVAKEHAKVAKEHYLPVIIGGIHISVLPHTLTRDMDIGVVGEGEETIIEVLHSFLDKGYFSTDIKGTIFWDARKSKVLVNEPRPLINNIDSIPYPYRALLSIDKHASMITSRGCPYNCAFCATSRYTGNQARYASAAYVVNEIESIYKKYGVDYITIYDDLFAINSKRVAQIIYLLSDKGLLGRIRFAINTRCDFITDKLAMTLKNLNTHVVALGVETGCQKTLDYLKTGGVTVEDNANAIRILKRHDIKPYCSFIIGSPKESREDILETVKFIKRNRVEYFDVNILVPFPGTPVWDYAKLKGKVSDDMDWGRLAFNINHYNSVIISEELDRVQLLKTYKKLYFIKRYHTRKRRIIRMAKRPHYYISVYFRALLNSLKEYK